MTAIQRFALVCCLIPAHAAAQPDDPLLRFIIASDGKNASIGGNLQNFFPEEFTSPSVGLGSLTGGLALFSAYSDYYRSGGMEAPGASFRREFGGRAHLSGGNRIQWQLSVGEMSRRMRLSLLRQGLEQDVQVRKTDAQTSIKSIIRYGFGIWSGNIAVAKGRPINKRMMLGAKTRSWGSAAVEWRQDFSEPVLSAQYNNEQMNSRIGSQRETLSGWLMTPHLGQFSAGLRLAKTDWLRYSPSGEATTLEPWGWTEDYSWQMSYDFDFLTASMGARSLLVRLLAYGMDDAMPFAKLTKVDGEVQGWFGSAHRLIGSGGSELIVEAEYLKWTGSARGHVEFWPFTSGWVDLLGQRRYFIADTEGWLYRLHIGGRKSCSGGWSVAGGVNLLDIYPHLELQHWRPAFLLFGKEDEQFLTTPVKRTLVGVFNFSLSYQYSFWSVEYGLAQAAPLRTWRPAEVEAAPAPAAPKRAVYGGGFHSLSLVINFPMRRS